jgi:hypothetical protein
MLPSATSPYRAGFDSDYAMRSTAHTSSPTAAFGYRHAAATHKGPLSADMPLTDEDAAIEAVASLESLSDEQQAALRSINTIMHDGESFVDVYELFRLYDALYFRQLLSQRVEVMWSPRLTL